MREKKQINIEIGEQVRVAREQKRLTQEMLAEKIEVSPQYISDLERGVVGISLPTLKRLCVSLGISSDQILFAKQPESDVAALTEKCKHLSPKHLELLSNIIDNYIDAVSKE